MSKQHQNQNSLQLYRRRMMFSTAHVARLLGHSHASTVREFEHGRRLPSLLNALRLSIILRVPVEFLFPDRYNRLKAEIRAVEDGRAVEAEATVADADGGDA